MQRARSTKILPRGTSPSSPVRRELQSVVVASAHNDGPQTANRMSSAGLDAESQAREADTSSLLGPDAQPGLRKKRRIRPFEGLEWSWELFAIGAVYFVQGILGLSRLALTYFYKDEFHLQPATVALVMSFGAAPWVIKPLYGFLSDTVPIWGYRRRSYLILGGVVGAASWLAMATVVNSPTTAVAAVILGSATTACSDVVVDSIVVERSRGGPQELAGSLQSLCWASAATGGVASAYFSGSLVESYGARTVFALTAIFPLLVSGAAFAVAEQPVSGSSVSPRSGNVGPSIKERFMEQLKALWAAVSQRSILYPAVFVFLWQATPTSETAMFFFQTNKLGFTPEFLGRVRLVAALASLGGVACYNYVLKPIPIRKVLLWTALLGTALGLTQLILITGANEKLGLSNELFALGDSLVLTVLGQVSFMPLLVLAARICPEGVEATLFATLMSILNGGAFVGSAAGSLLTSWFGVTAENFDNLAILVLLCTLSSLAPLPLLRLVPDLKNSAEDDGSDDGKSDD
ncbi:hypothetical protein WJX73_008456 [Symbiochloris irregularis]|uniref:Uncharacterized protein n=1 Tax=Symbiochloris irregularis TaxID=706552 RepID=A0AAW1P1I7_9CHLO